MKLQLILFCFLFFQLNLKAQSQPNILWIVCEDISPTLDIFVRIIKKQIINLPHREPLGIKTMLKHIGKIVQQENLSLRLLISMIRMKVNFGKRVICL